MIAHDTVQSLWKSYPEFYRVHLAESLITLSLCRGGMGQLDSALPANADATATHGELAKTNKVFNPNLAGSLNNLSLSRLSDLGRSEEAFVAIEEAVEIRRVLANTNS